MIHLATASIVQGNANSTEHSHFANTSPEFLVTSPHLALHRVESLNAYNPYVFYQVGLSAHRLLTVHRW